MRSLKSVYQNGVFNFGFTNIFNVKPENLEKISSLLTQAGIEHKTVATRTVGYYGCCPSCDGEPFLTREMAAVAVNMSGRKFHHFLVNNHIISCSCNDCKKRLMKTGRPCTCGSNLPWQMCGNTEYCG